MPVIMQSGGKGKEGERCIKRIAGSVRVNGLRLERGSKRE